MPWFPKLRMAPLLFLYFLLMATVDPCLGLIMEFNLLELLTGVDQKSLTKIMANVDIRLPTGPRPIDLTTTTLFTYSRILAHNAYDFKQLHIKLAESPERQRLWAETARQLGPFLGLFADTAYSLEKLVMQPAIVNALTPDNLIDYFPVSDSLTWTQPLHRDNAAVYTRDSVVSLLKRLCFRPKLLITDYFQIGILQNVQRDDLFAVLMALGPVLSLSQGMRALRAMENNIYGLLNGVALPPGLICQLFLLKLANIIASDNILMMPSEFDRMLLIWNILKQHLLKPADLSQTLPSLIERWLRSVNSVISYRELFHHLRSILYQRYPPADEYTFPVLLLSEDVDETRLWLEVSLVELVLAASNSLPGDQTVHDERDWIVENIDADHLPTFLVRTFLEKVKSRDFHAKLRSNPHAMRFNWSKHVAFPTPEETFSLRSRFALSYILPSAESFITLNSNIRTPAHTVELDPAVSLCLGMGEVRPSWNSILEQPVILFGHRTFRRFHLQIIIVEEIIRRRLLLGTHGTLPCWYMGAHRDDLMAIIKAIPTLGHLKWRIDLRALLIVPHQPIINQIFICPPLDGSHSYYLEDTVVMKATIAGWLEEINRRDPQLSEKINYLFQ